MSPCPSPCPCPCLRYSMFHVYVPMFPCQMFSMSPCFRNFANGTKRHLLFVCCKQNKKRKFIFLGRQKLSGLILLSQTQRCQLRCRWVNFKNLHWLAFYLKEKYKKIQARMNCTVLPNTFQAKASKRGHSGQCLKKRDSWMKLYWLSGVVTAETNLN
jgi:hypothetical protein